jgi:hypothetical protein
LFFYKINLVFGFAKLVLGHSKMAFGNGNVAFGNIIYVALKIIFHKAQHKVENVSTIQAKSDA